MILARQNVDISLVLIAILEMHVFHSDVYFILSLICLEEIRKFEDSRGSNKLIKKISLMCWTCVAFSLKFVLYKKYENSMISEGRISW